MKNIEDFNLPDIEELDDDMLDNVSGGVSVGDVVDIKSHQIQYCQCGRLLMNYKATITGVRGVLDGKTLYWVQRACCGHKSSVIETSIVKP